MKTFAFLYVLFLTLSINQLHSQTCSGKQTITSNSGTFNDRTSGETYGDNLDCRWLIQPANGRRVTITFSRFSTEQNVDFVTIYDGATVNDRVLGRFSGSSLPMSVTATGGVALLRFTSDAFVGFNGWAVNYVTESASAIDPTQI